MNDVIGVLVAAIIAVIGTLVGWGMRGVTSNEDHKRLKAELDRQVDEELEEILKTTTEPSPEQALADRLNR